MKRPCAPLALAAAVAVLLASAAPAAAKTETAGAGDVTAAFSYNYDSSTFSYSGVRLTITRAGQTLFDSPVGDCDAYGYCDGPGDYGKRSVAVRDLDRDGDPEVILDLTTGAHCCELTTVYRFTGTGYSARTIDFQDFGYTLTDLDHDRRPEFVTGDTRFAYVFTDFADSYFPRRIYEYNGGNFLLRTRRFKAAVRSDASRCWRLYLRNRGKRDVRGLLAAYQADEITLRQGSAGWRKLRLALHRGDLNVGAGQPKGSAYLSLLGRKLRHWGYR